MRRDIAALIFVLMLALSVAGRFWQLTAFSAAAIVALIVDALGLAKPVERWSRGRRVLLEGLMLLLFEGVLLALAPNVTLPRALLAVPIIFLPIDLLWLGFRWRALGR
jgi:hypothetical protein